jgi:DNA-binding MarR family transcriptional regulator
MSEAGLLINKTGADRREKFWFLTQLGQEKLREAEPLWVDAQKDFKKHFGKEKARRLRELSVEVTELFFLP